LINKEKYCKKGTNGKKISFPICVAAKLLLDCDIVEEKLVKERGRKREKEREREKKKQKEKVFKWRRRK